METWDELDNKDNLDKDKGAANMALVALTSSNTKSESTSDPKSEEEDEVIFNLSCSNMISFI